MDPTSGISTSIRSELAIQNLLSQFPLSAARAEVLEVVKLTTENALSLLAQNALPESQLQRLKNALASLSASAPLQTNESKNAKYTPPVQSFNMHLIKLRLMAGSGLSTWALSEVALEKNSTIDIARRIDGLVLSQASVEAKVGTHRNTASESVSPATSRLISGTVATSEMNLSNSLAQKTAIEKLSIPEQKLLNQLTKLSLPIQDKALRFLSTLSPAILQNRPELGRLLNNKETELHARVLDVMRSIDNVIAKSPQFKNLSPEALVKTLQSTGVFLESNALRNASEDSNPYGKTRLPPFSQGEDLKAVLYSVVKLFGSFSAVLSNPATEKNTGILESIIKLLFQHRSRPLDQLREADAKKMLRVLEQTAAASLARIVSNQSQSLMQTAGPESQQLLNINTDLLLRHNEQVIPVHIWLREEIENENEGRKPDQAKKRTWVVFLEWQFVEIGTYHCEVKVLNEKLKARIWIENNHIKQLFRNNISKLRENLERKNIWVQKLEIEDLPLSSRVKTRANSTQLIDLKT